jgi:hypothetical protein
MMEKFEFYWSYGLLSIIFLLLISVAATSALADGRVNYCTIDAITHSDGPTVNYILKGHVSWRPDRTLGRFSSFDETLSAAKQINCEIR